MLLMGSLEPELKISQQIRQSGQGCMLRAWLENPHVTHQTSGLLLCVQWL